MDELNLNFTAADVQGDQAYQSQKLDTYEVDVTSAYKESEAVTYFAMSQFFNFDWVPEMSGVESVDWWSENIEELCSRLQD